MGFMDVKTCFGLYYDSRLQQTFMSMEEVEEYIKHEIEDSNCERFLFEVKVLKR